MYFISLKRNNAEGGEWRQKKKNIRQTCNPNGLVELLFTKLGLLLGQ